MCTHSTGQLGLCLRLCHLPCARMRPEQLAYSAAGAASQQRSGWEPCVSPATFSGLEEGKWGLTLRATDRAGLVRTTRRVLQRWPCTRPALHVVACPCALEPSTTLGMAGLEFLLASQPRQ